MKTFASTLYKICLILTWILLTKRVDVIGLIQMLWWKVEKKVLLPLLYLKHLPG